MKHQQLLYEARTVNQRNQASCCYIIIKQLLEYTDPAINQIASIDQ